MDLRHLNLSAAQIQELHQFIRERKLGYQPFVFTDTLQVGEGQRFRDGEFAPQCGEVLWEGHPPDLAEVPNLITHDPAAFQDANHELRKIYDGMVDFVVRNSGEDISQLSFAEFGCNTGYFLHSLAARGAGKTTGYDFTPGEAIFRWFNNALGIPQERNAFRFAEWDSLNHCARYCTFDEADVCMSIAVTTHLADPLHHLAFLCSKARKAVFLWCQVSDRDDLSLTFGTPGKYPNPLAFPINFDNNIRMSPALLRLTLERCGFEDIIEIEWPNVSLPFQRFVKSQKGFLARRTSSPATVYTGGRRRRVLSGDAPVSAFEASGRVNEADVFGMPEDQMPLTVLETPVLVEQDYRGFNIVRLRRKYIAVKQSVGSLDLASVDDTWLSERIKAREVCVADSLDAARRQIDAVTIELLTETVRKLREQAEKAETPKRRLTLRWPRMPVEVA